MSFFSSLMDRVVKFIIGDFTDYDEYEELSVEESATSDAEDYVADTLRESQPRTFRDFMRLLIEPYDEMEEPDGQQEIVSQKAFTHVKHGCDLALALTVLLIMGMGLVLLLGITLNDVYGSRPSMFSFQRQIVYVAVGVVLAVIMSFISYHSVVKYRWWFFSFACLLGILWLIFGQEGLLSFGGLNIRTDGLNIRTDGLIYVSLIPILAGLLDKDTGLTSGSVITGVMMVAIASAIVILQHNIAAAVIVMPIVAIGMLFLKRPLWAIVLFFAPVAILAYFLATQTLTRIELWTDSLFGTELAYQTEQSFYAIAGGGIFGQGIGTKTTSIFLPYADSGFIMSSISNQLGLVGTLSILILFIFLVARIALIALKSRDKIGFYLCAGIAMKFTVTIILNLLVAVNLLPTINTGGLPFIGYNGSVVIYDAICIGIILNVSKYTAERPTPKKKVR